MTLPRALFLLAALGQSSLFANDGSLILVSRIAGLRWRTHEVRRNAQKERSLHLEGNFERAGWSLVDEKGPIPVLHGGAFTIDKTMKGRVLSVDLVAVGPNGEVESETVGFFEGPPSPSRALPVPAPAETTAPYGIARRDSWLDFQVGTLAVLQRDVGLSLAPKASWTPRYSLSGSSGVRANLGLALLRRFSAGAFVSLDSALLFSQDVGAGFQIEAGGGAETWWNYGGTRALLRLNVGWLVGARYWGLNLDRITLAYSLLPDAGPTQSLFVGAGLSL